MFRAYADWGLLYLMYRTCSLERVFLQILAAAVVYEDGCIHIRNMLSIK